MGRKVVISLVVVLAATLALGIVGASGRSGGNPNCPPDGYNGYGGPGYNGYGGPGYNGYGGPGYNGYNGYGGPGPCPPCPPPGQGNGNGHDKDRGEGHDRGQGRGHCKDDQPEARFTYDPHAPEVGQTVHFDASLSNDDASDPIVSYMWDFDGDGQFDDGTGEDIDHVFTTPGKVDVGLKVTDADGDTDTTTETVNVKDRPNQPKAPKDEAKVDDPPQADPPKSDPPKAKGAPKPTVTIASNQKLSEVLSKGVVLVATCSQSCNANLAVAAQGKGTKKAAATKLKRKLKGGKATKIRVKLSKKTRRAIGRSRKATLVITLAVTDAAGNAAKVSRKALARGSTIRGRRTP
jgi:PKD domain